MSYSQHAGFFGTTRTLLGIVGFEGSIRQANMAWGYALGYTWEEIVAIGFIDLLHPDDQKPILQEMEKLSQGKLDPVAFSARLLHRDGHYLDYLWEATPALMEFAFYVAGIPSDICFASAQTQLQAQQNEEYVRLQEKHADLELLYQELQTQKGFSLNGINSAILDTILSHINESVLVRQPGELPYTLTPQQTNAVFGTMPTAETFIALWKLAQEAPHQPTHHTLKTNQKRVSVFGNTIEADDKTPQMLIVCDIQEQHLFKHSLSDLKEEYSLLTAARREGILDWDLTTQTVNYSHSWARLLGYEKETIGRQIIAWQNRVHPADHTHLIQELKLCINGQHKNGLDFKHRAQHKDGSYRWLHAIGEVVFNKRHAKHFIISFVDITRQMELEIAITSLKKTKINLSST